ncbi:hypothetical protein PoB_006327500 [Plakobranchus ocellatus]|uniref:Uncharacterized protein n=1 Tax=Plakobranchus ocellatus TaxID=259542 RepID=A0AAV4CY84_9GAST|nr:hypothetical protein PoB_006327500 [Plakobranchus ocellatus]
MDTQRKSLLDGCDDWEFSADLPKVIEDTGMTSYSIQVLLDKSSSSNSQYDTRVEWKRQMCIKREKYKDWSKKLEKLDTNPRHCL